MKHDTPFLMKGGRAVDDRGVLTFVNDFEFLGVKRFYQVSNHKARFVRAWHGHRKEGKYVTVTRGSAIIACLPIDDIKKLAEQYLQRHVMSDVNPAVLWIPPGYVNGAMTLTDDTLITYYSTATMEESKDDDLRFEARWLNHIWNVEER